MAKLLVFLKQILETVIASVVFVGWAGYSIDHFFWTT